MSFSQGFNDVRARARQGIVGEWSMYPGLFATGMNANPQAAQVSTIKVDTEQNNHKYTVFVNGVGVSFTSDSTGTKAEIADGLAAALNADPIARGVASAVSDGVDTVTLTGTWPGVPFIVITADANLTVATVTAAAAAAAIPFGRAVLDDGIVSDEGERQVKLAVGSAFAKQVKTAEIDYVASAVIGVRVFEVRGEERVLLAEVQHTSATDQDTTIDALVTLLEARLPANSVEVTADDATATALVFTSEVDGLEFDVEVFDLGGGATSPDIVVSDIVGPDAGTSLHRALAGVSMYSENDPTATIGGTEGQYAPNAGVRFAYSGELWVERPGAVVQGGTVYVGLGAAEAGKFFATPGTGRVALSKGLARWSRDGVNSADGVAALRVTL